MLDVFLASIPTYIGGFFSFVIASNKIDSKKVIPEIIKKRNAKLNLKTSYYNADVHLGSFSLPNYINKLIGKNGK